MEFTEDQREAIAHRDGHLQLIACAGSGKTEVVARRVARLLDPSAPDPIAPSAIVAFTFTDKAAAELKERITARVHEAHGPLPGLAEMFVGTIHGYCLELLRREVPAFLGYEVLDEVAQRMLVERHPERSGRAGTTTLWGDPLAAWRDTGVYLGALDVLRQAEVDTAKLSGVTALDGLAAWRELLEDRRRLDYTAIMEHAVRVLRDDAGVRARLAGSVRHVIVDEYQDVNPMQERVVRALADLGAWLCVVGDDDQSIYQWNGASVTNILTFASRYPAVRAIRLQENFRSSRAVVDLARDFIAQSRERLAKDMVSTDAQATDPGDVLARRFSDARDEARWIADQFQGLRGAPIREREASRGIAWSDMAVLIRSDLRRSARALIEVFKERGIPYVVSGLNSLFETAEAKASAALMRFVAGGEPSVDELIAAWDLAALGLQRARLDDAVRYADAVREEVAFAEHGAHELLPQRVYLEFLGRAGLREEVVPGEEGRGQAVVANLGVFSSLLADFEAVHHHSALSTRYAQLAAFLDNAAKDQYAEGLLGESLAAPDAVRITTIHKAKGLQWPVVAVPGLIDGRFPARTSTQDPRRKKRRDWWDLIPIEAVRDGARYRGGVDDERRLFYVAVTRAQKWLLLTFAPSPDFAFLNRPSPFLQWAERHPRVSARDPAGARASLEPTPRRGVSNVTLDFTTMKDLFECPHRFRLQRLYGFSPPPDPAQGFGASIHDALAAVHRRALAGERVTVDDVPALLADHLRLPFAPPELFEQRRDHAARILTRYLERHGDALDAVEFVEQTIELPLGDGVTVTGRIDLVTRRTDGSASIVDFKSSAHAQAERQTQAQLHLYALGYRALTGRDARAVEVWELDHDTRDARPVDDAMLDAVRAQAARAAAMLREAKLPPNPSAARCGRCAMRALCPAGEEALAAEAPGEVPSP